MTGRTGTPRFVRSNEELAFAELYNRYYRSIQDYCRRRVAGDLVDDVVAETFLTAWRRLDDVPAGDAALVWLYRVAYRLVGHQWRSTARRLRLEARLRFVVHHHTFPADESVIDGAEHRLALDAAACLGTTDSEVLRLAAWEQLSIADISAVLEITPNATKQRLHRAKQNLAREYRRLESRQTSTPDARKGGAR
jgi:RNA polymerase sigma factor (sigma-70 family)